MKEWTQINTYFLGNKNLISSKKGAPNEWKSSFTHIWSLHGFEVTGKKTFKALLSGKWAEEDVTFQGRIGVRRLILYTCWFSVVLLVRCESHCPVCFLRLLFSTRRVLYRHPLGFGPTAKPIRLECCGSLGVAAWRACFQDWAAVWVSLVQQVQQHRGAGCRRLKVGTAATGSFSRLSCSSRWQPSLSVAEPTMTPKWPHA